MKKLLNILIVFSVFAILNGCGSHRKMVDDTEVLSASMRHVLVIDDAKRYQVDSLITADTLPSLDKWLIGTFVDKTTNKIYIKRVYIRNTNDIEIVYTITGENEPFDIIKRIRK